MFGTLAEINGTSLYAYYCCYYGSVGCVLYPSECGVRVWPRERKEDSKCPFKILTTMQPSKAKGPRDVASKLLKVFCEGLNESSWVIGFTVLCWHCIN